ncbi:ATP-binding cassette domain-containing protein [Streptomyces sp. NPDC007189]|uniref:ABC transporter ATP-binding protein n=1 Tax=Streptomyces sp. NPDC007189 TaxID=3154315 RepID=UPI00345184FD
MIQAFGLTSTPRKAYPPAVDDVTFEARAGHVTVLLGDAGAGKTTALRLMLELQPGRGITYFRGRPLHHIAHPAREVGVLLGDVPGHPARSVRGHLRMLCAASGVPARRADEVLEVVGLVSFRDEPLGTLSRGMDRRLGLACALLPDPHTLVLDEPAADLSAREAQWLHGMLRAHAGQGGTVLFTTADPKEAASTADRVVTLDGGRVVADQEAAEFARTRLRPRVAVRSPHAARLAALLTKEARTARRSVEVVREGGNRLSVYGSTTADVGETAFRHGILVHQLADEVGDMGPGSEGGPALAFAEAGVAEPRIERTHAGPGSSSTEPETVRDLSAVEPDASAFGLAASASGPQALGLAAAGAGASAHDSPERAAPVASGLPSGERDGAATGHTAKERHATPFGFTAPQRGDTAAGTPAQQRSVPSAAAGEEPSAGEGTQAPSGARTSLAETSPDRSAAERTETTRRLRSEGMPPADKVPGMSGPVHVGPAGGEDAAEGGPGAVPAVVPAGADGGRSADSAASANARRDAAPAAREPQTGSTRTLAVGISALRTRLPGARKPRPRQPQATHAARLDDAPSVDALSPLPPPIAVRPAPSPLRPLRYEIRRATGIGVGFLTCGAVLAVSALTAVVLARIGHTPQARLFAAWPRQLPLPPAALAAGLLGALAFGDEFRHPALAADRGTVPRRLGLLTAKLLVSGATAALLAFLTLGCDAEALYIVYGRELTQVPPDWLSLSVSWFGLVVGCAWAGVLSAGVFRSTSAGLAAVLAVPVAVVPCVHTVMGGSAPRMAAGFPMRMREVLLLQWPFGGERYLLGFARVLAQPVGGAMALSLSALLCAYLFTTLRTRFR